MNRFSCFYTGRETENMAWGMWTRLLPLLALPISKAGVNTGSNQENVAEHCFCNEKTLFIKFFGH